MSLTVVLGLTGLAVDVGYAHYRKESCKAAAMAAAAAGAKVAQSAANYVCGVGVVCQGPTACTAALTNPASPIEAACLYAKKNGFTNDTAHQTRTVTVATGNSNPPVPGLTPTYWMSVTVSEKRPVWFGAALGLAGLQVSARSTAAYFKPGNGGCIYTLEPSLPAITNSGTSVLSTGCGLYVNSTNAAAVNLNGGASITATNGSSVEIAGNWTNTGGSTITPAPHLGATPAPDPFAAMQPPSDGACTSTGVSLGSHQSATIDPGVICGPITIGSQASLTLRPGLYTLKNGMSATGQGNISGTGVTLYIKQGALALTGGGTINLNAPTSGAWQGILFYQDRANTSAASLVGNSGSVLNGVTYIPSAALDLAGGSSVNAATVVARTIRLVGNTTFANPVTTKYTAGTAGVYVVE